MKLISENITKAILFAKEAHEGQLRKDNKPYIIHPLSVGYILQSAKYSEDVIIAGILHDIIEDTKYTEEDIIKMFNSRVAQLVKGVTLNKDLPKEKRRLAYLENLKIADNEIKAISGADLLDNRRAIITAIEEGFDIWSMLKISPEKYIEESIEKLNIIKETLNNEITEEAGLVINKIKNLI
ncbi:MAG: HD domain protein [Candidatus Nomurabacteria bacterium GW2011_GWE1_32_28]|uniref:HD domain protein n=1 Tax=Candidatus Nomurabacteria bacterium GW2011_GWF1_31_48 TaxID=1618767 RepID=A0A0F9YFU5_9BACT|nr:MAG: HD domain protein [Candidatus Nomurabacteria bacterium GW2011_GWF2_30_133]KKP28681.1 MAG: HD domain protein [Candidatus Nomurabacteria bacterium GW2011_GWE2_31_40]KKP30258.1 MAG: HD domain protein [Candidatus Nomurabacteria bacterium GW2011_GWF1_31_48]KKP34785.1 MAG: HD domain protein [Candidatus Nomurabacteria bacterium GW2011_GWE1_32_28]HAS80757.1 phosphohydrolase [Candidatus Nomurabacteria bacterium]